MKTKATVVALNETEDIYVVVDEGGQAIGSGTRAVCEVLARLASGAVAALPAKSFPASTTERENIRSAIKV